MVDLCPKIIPECAAAKGLAGAAADATGDAASAGAGKVLETVAHEFTGGAVSLLGSMAQNWYSNTTNLDFLGPGVDRVYLWSTGVGSFVATMVLLSGIVRTAWSADGRFVGAGLVGLVKAVFAIILTMAFARAGAGLSKYLTDSIMSLSGTSFEAFQKQFAVLATAELNPALVLVFGIIAILILVVLWAEITFVEVALAALVATAPIGASGLGSEATAGWWKRAAWACARLLMVPPAITLCFSLGFEETATADGVGDYLRALMTLGAAVLCWPALARFFAVDMDGQASGGLSLLLGAAGDLTSRASGMGQGGGNPLDAVGLQRGGGGASAGGASGGGAGAAGAAGGALAFLPAAVAATSAAVGAFQRGMGRTAAHAGLGPMGESVQTPWVRGRGSPRSGSGGSGGPAAESSPPPDAPAPLAGGYGGPPPVATAPADGGAGAPAPPSAPAPARPGPPVPDGPGDPWAPPRRPA